MTPFHLRAAPLQLAVLAALATTSTAFAATVDRQAAFTRAVQQVQAFPGRTAHAAGHTYVLKDVIVDADGSQHVRMDRLYKGLRVIGGDLVVHSNRSGAFLDASRTLQSGFTMTTSGRLSGAEAIVAALKVHSGDTQGLRPELVVYARNDRPALAWDVRVFGQQADGTPSELHVIVHADSGALLDSWDDIETAAAIGTGHSLFDGTVSLNTNSTSTGFALTDTTRGSSNTLDMKNRQFGKGTLFTDADNTWGDGTTADRATVAVDAAFGGAVTWDYYKNIHGRTGIANNGVGANSRVHYGRNYANAFWSDSCFCMTYGDGSGTIRPLVSLDVAGHEMSHGVTSRTAGLIYSGESGGLNEATSDIFGTMVEFYANNTNDPGDYLIGEKLFTNGSVIRSMIKPSIDGFSYDCYTATVGNVDVHYSSGVANHFYYLLAEGTTAGSPSPTCKSTDTRVATGTGTLAGIGRAKAEKIWYLALTTQMTSNTNYAGARAATLSAATTLYGAGSAEYNAVAAAWTAVNRP